MLSRVGIHKRQDDSAEQPPKKKSSTHHSTVHPVARNIGSVATGMIEALMMWPFDKYKNNRMGSSQKFTSLSAKILQTILGPDYRTLSPYRAVRHCYRGFPSYCLHKIFNRFLKLGCQQRLMEYMMSTSLFKYSASTLGQDNMKLAAALFSGVSVGLIEVSGNPLDRMKIICQKKNITMRAALRQMRTEGLRAQYSGAMETAVRNGIGSGSLFLGKFLAYRLIGVNDHNNPTLIESFLSSTVGAVPMITLSHLPDVLKVRAQMDPLNKMSMRHRLFSIVKNEGVSALYQGFFSKGVGAVLKFSCVMTFCEWLVKEINKQFVVDEQSAVVPRRPR